MSYTEAPNLKVSVNGASLTYRDVGKKDGIPIVLLNHWGGTLDTFDPAIVDKLAEQHRVITTNYFGIGNSQGKIKTTIREMSNDFIALLDALKLDKVYLFGYSLGGFVAQDVALLIPNRIKTLTLAGTGPAGGYKIGGWQLVHWYKLIFKAVFLFQEPRRQLFFPHTQEGKKNAYEFIKRSTVRKTNKDGALSLYAMFLQAIAINRWGKQKPENLQEKLKMPVLVVNGDDDLMVPTQNSNDIAKRIPNAKLVIYSKAGHGGIFQYADEFSNSLLNLISTSEKSDL